MNKVILQRLLTFSLMFFSLFAIAQQVTGKVVDESNEPLIGANIVVKGTSNGATTDFDGNYTIKVSEFPITLSVSSVGYESIQRTVTEAGTVNITMKESATKLTEVVITGLAGTSVKKSNAANAVSSISAEDLVGTTPPATLDGALYGKFTGAIVSANSGAPGGGMSVKMRGITSIQGNSQPLYIVDGVYIDNSSISAGLNTVSGAASGGSQSNQDNPTNRIADISPDDIENIEILKGASAAAIYGSRAAAGVVIITTKKGKRGETKINIKQSAGVSRALKLLGTRNYTLERVQASFPKEVDDFLAAQREGRLVDYEKELFGNQGFINKTVLSASGGGEKTTFFAGVSYQDEEGIVKNTGYEKTSLRLNIDNKITDKIKLGVNSNYIKSSSDRGFFNNDNTGTTMGVALTSVRPWLQLFPDASGVYPDNPSGSSNLLQTRDVMTNNETNSRFILGGNLDIKLYDSEKSNLKLLVRAGLDTYTFETKAIFPRELQFQKTENGGIGGVSAQGTTKVFNNNKSAFLIHNFNTDNNINFRTQAGLTNEVFDRNTILTTATGLVTGQTNLDLAANRGTVQNRLQQEDMGFFIQEEVNFNDIVIATAGIRGDKSTNNFDVNKLYYYPKASLAFNIAELLKPKTDDFEETQTLSLLKLRAAYGESGNFAFFGANRTTFGSTNINGLSGITLNNTIGDPNIGPERQKELEFGTDLGFFNDKLGLQFTYYKKTVDDLIISSAIEPSSGYAFQTVNAGDLENKGIEIGLNFTPVETEKFRWNGVLNFFKNQSKITKLNVPAYNLGGFASILGMFRIEEGKSATQIVGTVPGGELEVLGDAEADFQLSWQNNISYKNFDLSFLWHWKKGGDNINLTALLGDFNGTTFDYDDIDLDPEGKLGNGPYRLSQFGTSAKPFIEDASYIRLREVGLYYNIPSKVLKSAFKETISSFSLGFSGNNLLNFFKYRSYDPEVSNFGSNGISTGVEVTPFPSSKRYMFHINVGL